MAYGDIHNSSGTICKAQSDATCPLSTDGGHSKDIDSYVDYQVENSGVDGNAVRTMIADGTPPADAVEVAKAGHGALASTASRSQVDPHVRKSVEADLADQYYDNLMKKRNISRLSPGQWQILTDEQGAKTQKAIAAFEEAQRSVGYSLYEEGALDHNHLAIDGSLDKVRESVERRRVEAEENSSTYVQMNYRNAQAALERLEKVVKPGEEQKYVEEQSAKLRHVESFDDAVRLEKEKHELLKSVTEKSKAISPAK